MFAQLGQGYRSRSMVLKERFVRSNSVVHVADLRSRPLATL
jgi:hypothetical protein